MKTIGLIKIFLASNSRNYFRITPVLFALLFSGIAAGLFEFSYSENSELFSEIMLENNNQNNHNSFGQRIAFSCNDAGRRCRSDSDCCSGVCGTSATGPENVCIGGAPEKCECKWNWQCGSGYKCDGCNCYPEKQKCDCSRDSQCGHGAKCDGCYCYYPAPVCECSRDSDCPSGHECDGCYCRKSCACSSDSHCTSNEFCDGCNCRPCSSGTKERRCKGNEIHWYNVSCSEWFGPVAGGDCSQSNSVTECDYWKCGVYGVNPTNKTAYRITHTGKCVRPAGGAQCIVEQGEETCKGEEYTVFCEYGCKPLGSDNANCLPKAVISADRPIERGLIIVPEFTSVQLHCNDSIDPDGSIETCNWTFSDKEGSIIKTSSQKQTSYLAQESLAIVKLEVCDNQGACSTEKIAINGIKKPEKEENGTTIAGHLPPVACIQITPEGHYGPPGTEFVFDASCSYDPDPGDFITSYLWIFGDRTTKTGQTITHTFEDDGSKYNIYDITLIVADNGGRYGNLETLYGIKTTSILISKELPNITIQASPGEGITPLTAILRVKEDKKYEFTEYLWNFGDGTEKTGSQEQTHTYTIPGNYNVFLVAIDQNGNTAIGRKTINAYRFRGISELTATNTEAGQLTNISIQCSSADAINLTIEKEDTATILSNVPCNSQTPYLPIHAGLHTLTASIPGCDTIECTQTTNFQVKPMPIQIRTPELSLTAVLTALTSLIIARKKAGSKNRLKQYL